MTDTDKTPPTLREAVAAVIAEAHAKYPSAMADPKCHLRKVLMPVGRLQDLQAAHEAPGAYGSPDVARLVERVIRDVSEIPDRNSPEDFPEAMIVTGDELRAIIEAALANLPAAPRPNPLVHKGLLAEIAELRERVEKLDGDVDHFHRKWKEAETRAEKAEADAKHHMAMIEALERQHATQGIAMLRRLEVGLRKISFQWSQDRVAVLGEVQRLIAEAEKPAENLTTEATDGEETHREGRRLEPPILDREDLGFGTEDREGDDVLRELDRDIAIHEAETDPETWRGKVEYSIRSIRRALGEGGDQ